MTTLSYILFVFTSLFSNSKIFFAQRKCLFSACLALLAIASSSSFPSLSYYLHSALFPTVSINIEHYFNKNNLNQVHAEVSWKIWKINSMKKAKTDWVAKSISKNKLGLSVLSKLAVTFFHPSSQDSSSVCDGKFGNDNMRIKEPVACNTYCSRN